MPKSKKQTVANRLNAQKSTGPKTEEGQKISSQNATKHGFYSKDIIIKSPNLTENHDDYENLVVSLFNEFQPVGEFQEQLVFKIANCLWRSRRVIRAETACINERLEDNIKYDSTLDPNISTIPIDFYAKLFLRYEMRLDRQLTRCYQMLTHNQKLHQRLALELEAKN